MKRGAEGTTPLGRVHVSGHAAQEQGFLCRAEVPVGTAGTGMQKHHAGTACRIPENIFILENGEPVGFKNGEAKGDPSPGMFLVDAGSVADNSRVVRRRQRLREGMFIVVSASTPRLAAPGTAGRHINAVSSTSSPRAVVGGRSCRAAGAP